MLTRILGLFGGSGGFIASEDILTAMRKSPTKWGTANTWAEWLERRAASEMKAQNV